ncbi:TPA: hypothetical protein RKX70_004184 [Escherichia coli]|nr:hypothetical protein [Salmonella enterica]EFG2528790.1 hypothetical protein [Escherichia coli]EKY8230917.1 hypothetical protein [Salmonella enterica]HDW0064497.1 hypothetical protein [Escherichia coli]
MRYINRPFFLWMALFLVGASIQAWFARNTEEAVKFLCASIVMLVLQLWLSRRTPPKDTAIAFFIFTIPALVVTAWAGIKMPQEASVGDYSEVSNGIRLSKNAAVHQELMALTERYFKDNTLSRWEAAELRHLTFERNGWLYRGNAAESQEEARVILRRTLNTPYKDKKEASL